MRAVGLFSAVKKDDPCKQEWVHICDKASFIPHRTGKITFQRVLVLADAHAQVVGGR
jgi:hypothetical protein